MWLHRRGLCRGRKTPSKGRGATNLVAGLIRHATAMPAPSQSEEESGRRLVREKAGPGGYGCLPRGRAPLAHGPDALPDALAALKKEKPCKWTPDPCICGGAGYDLIWACIPVGSFG